MNSRFRKLAVESLEGRSVLSTMVEADFNGDGYLDMAAITDPRTITVSLFDPADGGYDVSDILSLPNNQPIHDLVLADIDEIPVTLRMPQRPFGEDEAGGEALGFGGVEHVGQRVGCGHGALLVF